MRFAQRLAAFVLALALGAAPARSSQNSLVTPTTGPHTMADFTGNYLNPALDSILSNYSGASAPGVGSGGVPKPYQFWFDTSTSPSVLKMFDGTSWVSMGALDVSAHTWTAKTVEPVNAQTANYTLTTGDCGKLVSLNAGTNITLSLPQADGSFSTCWFDVFNRSASSVAVTPTTSLVNGQLSVSLGANIGLRVVSDGTNWQLASSSPNANAGSRVLLNTISVSGVSLISDTTSFLTGYSDYEVVLENIIPSSNASTLNMAVYSNGAFQTTAYLNGGISTFSNATSAGVSQSTFIQLSPVGTMSNVAAHGGLSGTVEFYNVVQTNSAKQISYRTASAYTSASHGSGTFGSAMWPSSGTPYAIAGFSIYASGNSTTVVGTISGTVKIYGKN